MKFYNTCLHLHPTIPSNYCAKIVMQTMEHFWDGMKIENFQDESLGGRVDLGTSLQVVIFRARASGRLMTMSLLFPCDL